MGNDGYARAWLYASANYIDKPYFNTIIIWSHDVIVDHNIKQAFTQSSIIYMHTHARRHAYIHTVYTNTHNYYIDHKLQQVENFTKFFEDWILIYIFEDVHLITTDRDKISMDKISIEFSWYVLNDTTANFKG